MVLFAIGLVCALGVSLSVAGTAEAQDLRSRQTCRGNVGTVPGTDGIYSLVAKNSSCRQARLVVKKFHTKHARTGSYRIRARGYRCDSGLTGGYEGLMVSCRRGARRVSWTAYLDPSVRRRSGRARLPNSGTSLAGWSSVKPRQWRAGPTVSSAHYINLRWSRWGKVAVGAGRMRIHTCEPNCLQSPVVRYKARLRAGKIKQCEGPDGSSRPTYTSVRSWVLIPKRNPFGLSPGWQANTMGLLCQK